MIGRRDNPEGLDTLCTHREVTGSVFFLFFFYFILFYFNFFNFNCSLVVFVCLSVCLFVCTVISQNLKNESANHHQSWSQASTSP